MKTCALDAEHANTPAPLFLEKQSTWRQTSSTDKPKSPKSRSSNLQWRAAKNFPSDARFREGLRKRGDTPVQPVGHVFPREVEIRRLTLAITSFECIAVVMIDISGVSV